MRESAIAPAVRLWLVLAGSSNLRSFSVGSFLFADIQNNQVDAAGLAILQFFAARGEGGIVSRESIFQEFTDSYDAVSLLLQRELIEEVGDGYCFQVELMRRWFARSVR